MTLLQYMVNVFEQTKEDELSRKKVTSCSLIPLREDMDDRIAQIKLKIAQSFSSSLGGQQIKKKTKS